MFAGSALILSARRNGREVDAAVAPDDARLTPAIAAMAAVARREVAPVRLLRVERINGAAPGAGPYRGAFVAAGFRDEGAFWPSGRS